ncbi:MAG: heat-inducible transcription repressor HrcA [Spirochaetes bacterium]|jgi:heat-inducible transcriptional repressor|nr:heat-inducible transcription repressor HrcA [Spirochaetota bacterium]
MNTGEKIDRPLNDREAAILGALVYEYITTGKPVGSRSFVHKYSFTLSPATMRNVMFDLEMMGYLMQPHTSAGRVPTDKGYRYYVDSLLDTYEFVMNEKVSVREEMIKREMQLDKIFSSLTKTISLASQYAGVVLTPRPDFTVLKHIELVLLDNNEILAILVTRNGIVINKKVTVSTNITQDELYRFSKFLTGELGGYSLFEIKKDMFESLRAVKGTEIDSAMALDIAELALAESEDPDLYIDGVQNLLHIPEMIEADRLKGLLRLVEEKKVLRGIIEKTMERDGVQTLIGEEITEAEVSGCSIVTSSYKIGNKRVGVVGIIGPTRMDYKKVVPLVDYTGKVFSEFLTKMSK